MKVRKLYLYRGSVKSPSNQNLIPPPERKFYACCSYLLFGDKSFFKLDGDMLGPYIKKPQFTPKLWFFEVQGIT
ncbi:hypothetical protein COJ27_21860 [Bacillus cereus]|uniref:Uncharacterized protein n=1 Tax=Bacillus cereus TaxID=1396 RepID=A0A9X6VKF8_BACCE|nr:hypothetical protein TU65_13400 [Bacillus wiedmannii]PFB25991.1 hypothetical protein CN388_20040 [Bacillus cereus]PEJ49872.1 hypothetical protein CN672_10575 [Bacillus wiedmannii]PEL14778.1 hypothetical protein CN599_27750 [Bacillus wiedmannii]PEM11092.1 hypothetical protein CN610_11040 [Bacillus wiedmannii]